MHFSKGLFWGGCHAVPHLQHSVVFLLELNLDGENSLVFWRACAQECGWVVMVCTFTLTAEVRKSLCSCHISWASLFGFPCQMFPIQSTLVSITTLKIDLRWQWILQLYCWLLHKLVSFSLKHHAILDKQSLSKSSSSLLKVLFLSSGKGLFLCPLRWLAPKATCCCWSKNVRNCRQCLAGAALGLFPMGILSWPSHPCSCGCPWAGKEQHRLSGGCRKQRHSFVWSHPWEPNASTQELNGTL